MSIGNEIVPVDKILGEFRVHGNSETGNLRSYIKTLKLDADVISNHSKQYFSSIRCRYLVARTVELAGFGFLLARIKQLKRRLRVQA